MALSYTIREGLAGFARAKFAAAMAVTALAVALVLIGLVGLLAWQGQQVANWLRQQVGVVEVFLEPVGESETERMRARLETLPGVASVDYVSRQEAVEQFREDFGEEAVLFEDELFLPASFRVHLQPHYAASDSLEQFKARVERWPNVDEVYYERTLVADVEANVRRYALVALGIGLLVVAAALLLVGNTVRLTIYARRLLIRTMKLVGATDAFIRRPFLVEGIVQGLAAGVVAALLVWALYAGLQRVVEGLGGEGWPGGSPWVALGGLVLFGVLLGWLASWVAVRHFIKRVRLS
ncbi:MAG TPA: permease-like cell division protein FtsX [Rubricoccaceae bacterium]|nr:permease-like cell division protein FtsX [Rubricoccaceae bacterium]